MNVRQRSESSDRGGRFERPPGRSGPSVLNTARRRDTSPSFCRESRSPNIPVWRLSPGLHQPASGLRLRPKSSRRSPLPKFLPTMNLSLRQPLLRLRVAPEAQPQDHEEPSTLRHPRITSRPKIIQRMGPRTTAPSPDECRGGVWRRSGGRVKMRTTRLLTNPVTQLVVAAEHSDQAAPVSAAGTVEEEEIEEEEADLAHYVEELEEDAAFEELEEETHAAGEHDHDHEHEQPAQEIAASAEASTSRRCGAVFRRTDFLGRSRYRGSGRSGRRSGRRSRTRRSPGRSGSGTGRRSRWQSE